MIHYSCDRCKRLIETEDELEGVKQRARADFLRGLEIGQTGHAFIVERSGEIVASSASEQSPGDHRRVRRWPRTPARSWPIRLRTAREYPPRCRTLHRIVRLSCSHLTLSSLRAGLLRTILLLSQEVNQKQFLKE